MEEWGEGLDDGIAEPSVETGVVVLDAVLAATVDHAAGWPDLAQDAPRPDTRHDLLAGGYALSGPVRRLVGHGRGER